jgi:AcrR family transcriptional regulator
LESQGELFTALEPMCRQSKERARLVHGISALPTRWRLLPSAQRGELLASVLHRVDVGPRAVSLAIDTVRVMNLLEEPAAELGPTTEDDGATLESGADALVSIAVPTNLKRAGIEMRLIVDGTDAEARAAPDVSLHQLLAQAYRCRRLLIEGRGASIREVAAAAGYSGSHFIKVARLGFLAPAIVDVLLSDQHPLEVTAKRLCRSIKVPVLSVTSR